ncbi:cytochrome P450 [Novosphingobium aquimarinum]|uniref:cytochrome P450 n=1 Tax=Novosphingobium aquimarinum TaxID=2682494 RepID=UPI0012EC7EDA|nr:cytochrome P450 [Novosphingobium aquimarinum]
MFPDPYYTKDLPPHVPEQLVHDFNLYDHETVDVFEAVHGLLDGDVPEIFWTRNNGGHWIATGAEAIDGVGKDYETFSATRLFVPDHQNADTPTFPPNDTDPPLHTTYRGAIAPLFQPSAIERYRDDIRALTLALIEPLKARGECEFMADFAGQMPVITFLGILGLPAEDRLPLLEIAEGIFKPRDDAHRFRSVEALTEYLTPYVEARRTAPIEGDPISHVVNQTDHGRPFTTEEALKLVRSTLVAGLDTVTAALGFTTRYLADNPKAREKLREDHSLHSKAIEEILRRFPVSANLGRYVTRDTVYRGVSMKRGDHIVWGVGMYNFDESRFACPMDVQLDRSRNRHGTFGVGNHFCVGAPLARAELKIFLELWLAHIPEFHIPDGEIVTYRNGFNAALSRLPLRFTKKPD